ncbi:MAG: hypothetical protein QOD86_279 [Miltoncostaeaceae bacterium]|jgi:hypothetical protein|nr:hypothetical protein [Miltoncostaeaceae bacterium]
MLRRLLIALALLAGVLTPVSGALAGEAAAAGSIGIRLVDVPVDDRDDPRARLYIVDRLAPGTVIHRRIEVSNTTAAPVSVAVYAGAATIGRGTFAFAPGREPNELTTWTSMGQDVLRLEPGASALDTVTIAVPRDASAGERYGVIWAETAAPPPAGGGVTLINRVGVRVYLSIGAGGGEPASFTIDGLRATRPSGGRPAVVADVHNTGGRALDIAGNLALSRGPGGLRAGPFPARLGTTLAPGDTAPVTVLLGEELPDGPWRARIALRSGLVERAVAATLSFPRAAEAGTARSRQVAIGIGIAGFLLLAAVALLLMRRRRASRRS